MDKHHVYFPKTAILLAAGLGLRMRPLTLKLPKPLVTINNISLLDRAINALKKAGVETIILNVHYLASQIEDHVRAIKSPRIIISDEREQLLESGGGVVKALPYLGSKPFYIINSDSFWIEDSVSNLKLLAQHFEQKTMDMMLLTVTPMNAHGVEKIDFHQAENGELRRLTENADGNESLVSNDVIYCGAMIADPKIFANAKKDKHSLNLYFDRAINKHRLFGQILEGIWFHVGTVAEIAKTENTLKAMNQEFTDRKKPIFII